MEEELCRIRDRRTDEDGEWHGECTRPVGHYGVVHSEYRGGRLWAEWRSVLPEDECRCHAGYCRYHGKAAGH
jgi:hypothetical protein